MTEPDWQSAIRYAGYVAPDVHGWQPIETAPKDGAEVLTWTPKENWELGTICGMHVGFWTNTFQQWQQSDLEWDLKPTHWMPLPAPPDKQGDGQ